MSQNRFHIWIGLPYLVCSGMPSPISHHSDLYVDVDFDDGFVTEDNNTLHLINRNQ